MRVLTYDGCFRRFSHGDRLDFSGEFFCTVRQHHVEVISQNDISVVDITQLINSLSDLNLLRDVDGIDLEFTTDWAFTCLARMNGERHLDCVFLAKLVRNLGVA